MGSPLSPVIAELFMEEFELDTIENDDLRPNLWLCYVDDTFVVWPHGKTVHGCTRKFTSNSYFLLSAPCKASNIADKDRKILT